MSEPLDLTFLNGNKACLIQVDSSVDLSAALRRIGLWKPRPTLVVVGGASKMTEESLVRLRQLFVEVLAPLAEELEAYVVDGGTDAGVMQMLGKARTDTAGTFPLIGVAPEGKIALPNTSSSPSSGKPLEPNHTHFILIPGATWGDESPWLARIATMLASDSPSVTVLINGGETALLDVFENIEVGRPVVVVAGSGRLADEIAQAVLYPQEEARERVAELIHTGQLRLFNFSKPLAMLAEVLKQQLTVKGTEVV